MRLPKQLILFTLFSFLTIDGVAQYELHQKRNQVHSCGTKSPSKKDYEYTRDVYPAIAALRNAGTTAVPIQVHIVQDNGVGGPSLQDFAKGLANLNHFFLEAGIEFFYKGFPNYVNNTDYYNFSMESSDMNGSDSEGGLAALFPVATDAVNIYFVNSITFSGGFSACGYAYFPFDATYSNRIVMDNGCFINAAPNGTIIHEVGHYFNLFHTHEGTEDGANSAFAENVARTGANANCDTDGDLLCDTDADPKYSSSNFNALTCTVPNPGADIHGENYVPPVSNIMSYYPDACGGNFSAGQSARMATALTVRLGHTSYSLDATPQVVTPPSTLSATFDSTNGKVDLTWTDVANNEMGYTIERSSVSASSDFVAVLNGGTSDNATQFSDTNVQSNTTYWYRVKAVNGNKDTYSPVSQVSVGLIYCTVGAAVCDEYISNVSCGSINNSSNCSSNGYQSYLNLSTNVEVGMATSIVVSNGNPYPEDECGIYVDWNQDGDFEDMDETIVVTNGANNSTFSGVITPPANALAGNTRMRIRISWNISPNACDLQNYGETEDYALQVSSSTLPIELISFTGRNTENGNKLNWQTAQETNNDYFLIERLNPISEKYENLTNIEGAGTSSSMNTYTWNDKTPLQGNNYYRLKQVDFDGAFTYSNIIVVYSNLTEQMEIKLYPNPVSQSEINLQSNINLNQVNKILVIDSYGKTVLTEIPSFENVSQTQINLSNFSKGIYFIKIEFKTPIHLPVVKRFIVN